MPFLKSLPDDARPGVLLKRHPQSGELMFHFTEVLLRGPASLTPAERELIAAYTSGINTCEFCCATHTATAEALGVEPGMLEQLLDDIDTAPVDERLKPILRFVSKLTRTPTAMTQADAGSIFEAGWDEDAYYHAVSICGLFNYYNRLIEGYGVKSAPAYRDLVGKRLAEQGYLSALEVED